MLDINEIKQKLNKDFKIYEDENLAVLLPETGQLKDLAGRYRSEDNYYSFDGEEAHFYFPVSEKFIKTGIIDNTMLKNIRKFLKELKKDFFIQQIDNMEYPDFVAEIESKNFFKKDNLSDEQINSILSRFIKNFENRDNLKKVIGEENYDKYKEQIDKWFNNSPDLKTLFKLYVEKFNEKVDIINDRYGINCQKIKIPKTNGQENKMELYRTVSKGKIEKREIDLNNFLKTGKISLVKKKKEKELTI